MLIIKGTPATLVHETQLYSVDRSSGRHGALKPQDTMAVIGAMPLSHLVMSCTILGLCTVLLWCVNVVLRVHTGGSRDDRSRTFTCMGCGTRGFANMTSLSRHVARSRHPECSASVTRALDAARARTQLQLLEAERQPSPNNPMPPSDLDPGDAEDHQPGREAHEAEQPSSPIARNGLQDESNNQHLSLPPAQSELTGASGLSIQGVHQGES